MPQILNQENIQHYKQKHLDDIKSIKQYKEWFETLEDIKEEEKSKIIQSLYQTILYNLSLYPSPFTFQDQKRCVETLICEELYQSIFINQSNFDQDIELNDKMEYMRKLPIEDFNLPSIFFTNNQIGLAMYQLSQINHKKTSYEKLECINAFFKHIIYYNEQTLSLNSDEILDIVVYLIVHTVSPLLYSNIAFIRTCSFDISDENDFYLTQLEIAIQTIMFYSQQKITNNETQLIQKMVLSPPIVNNDSFL